MSGEILIVDDERDAADLLGAALESRGHVTKAAYDLESAWAEFQNGAYDVVLTDLDLAGESGIELCSRISDQFPDVPVILITAHASVAAAVDALRAGAFDFLTKPVDMDQLRHRVEHALTHRELVTEVKRLRRITTDAPGASEIVGESPQMKKLYSMIARLGDSDAGVLITGESGVGKELVARALHAQGARADGPFVAVNCAAVPHNLIESELFGHVRGAFTDAKHNRDGLFVRANRGSLFLDEIGELPMDMQPKLLRALQERKVTPVGGDRERSFDARIIAATNRDLEEDVEEGRFREDLYYRINVVRLQVPPLRARGTDILLLAQHFVERIAERTGKSVEGLSPNAAEKLLAYDWPGNVRELENAMERGVALAQLSEIQVEDLPERVRAYEPTTMVVAGTDPSELMTLDELENRYIRRVLELVNGNKTQAAEILGLGRRTLYRRLERMEQESGDADSSD